MPPATLLRASVAALPRGIPPLPPKGPPERDIFLLVLSVGVGVWRGVLFSLSLKDSLHFWIKLQHVKIIILTCLVEVADSYSQSTITQMKILTTWKIQIFSITFVTVERLERISPSSTRIFRIQNGNRKSLSACISALGKDGCPSKPHIEVAMGTAAQAIAYCEKDGIFWKKALDQKDKVSDQILMLLPISFLTVVLCRKSLLLSHQYL